MSKLIKTEGWTLTEFNNALFKELEKTGQIIGLVSDTTNYVGSLAQAETEGKKHGFHVYSLQELVYAVATKDEFRKNIRPNWATTTTSRVRGNLNGVSVVQYQHGVGDLSTSSGVANAKAQGYLNNYFLNAELITEGIPIIGLTDLRNGKNTQRTGTVYQLENVRIVSPSTSDEDVKAMRKDGAVAYENSSYLNEGQVRLDDNFLASLGGPDGVDKFCAVLFGSKSNGGEERQSVGTYHGLTVKGLPDSGAGCPVFWDINNCGLSDYNLSDLGRFPSGK